MTEDLARRPFGGGLGGAGGPGGTGGLRRQGATRDSGRSSVKARSPSLREARSDKTTRAEAAESEYRVGVAL